MDKIIYNVSFMMERSLGAEFEGWLRKSALPRLADPAFGGRDPHLRLLADVPGNPDFSDQALTYAFQMEFDDEQAAARWGTRCLQLCRAEYEEKFGRERAVSFDSILRELPL